MPLTDVHRNDHVIQVDGGALLDLLEGGKVRLLVVEGGGELNLVGVLEHEGVLAGYVDEERGTREGSTLQLRLDVRVDECRNR